MKSILIGCFGLLLFSIQLGCCSVGPMGACGTSSCGVSGCGPLGGQGLGGLADRFSGIHCASACGEIYWDEQINEPPVCDPCGPNAEFTGAQSCARCPGALSKFRQLLGFTYAPGDCSSCAMGPVGCPDGSCASSGCSSCESNHYPNAMPANDPGSYAPHSPTPTTMRATAKPPANAGSIPTNRPTPATRKPAPVPDLEPTKAPPAPSLGRQQSGQRVNAPARLVVGSGVGVRQANHY